MADLNHAVKSYYEEAKLSDQQFERLMAMQAVSEEALVNGKEGGPVLGIISVAATFVLAILLVLVFNSESVSERVAQEVAMNHNKALTVEYQTGSYETLSQQMDKLDFSLRAPSHTSLEGFSLVGGRYCSIQGQLAAQIKLVDSTGQILTLYQTRAEKPLSVVGKEHVQLDQVDIRLWEEQGLLFALARSSSY